MRKLSFDEERSKTAVVVWVGGRRRIAKTWNAERKWKAIKRDYFKNKILTLIQAEMWKILISFIPKRVFKRFRLRNLYTFMFLSWFRTLYLKSSLKINSDYLRHSFLIFASFSFRAGWRKPFRLRYTLSKRYCFLVAIIIRELTATD